MKLYLNDYKEGQIFQVECDYDAEGLDLEFIDLKYLKPVHLTGTIEKGAEILTFRGNLQSLVRHLCGRCLKQVDDSVDKPFLLYYEVKDKTMVETTDDLRELLIMDHPITFLCEENCKGLCLHCGTDLNASQCQCVAQKPAERPKSLSALKEAWDKKYGGKK